MVKYQHMHDSNKKMQHFVKDIFMLQAEQESDQVFLLVHILKDAVFYMNVF